MEVVIEWAGAAAAAAMVHCYALEPRDPRFTFGFSASCAGAAAYAFAIGSWPFFALEMIWSVVALRRGWTAIDRAPTRRERNPT